MNMNKIMLYIEAHDQGLRKAFVLSTIHISEAMIFKTQPMIIKMAMQCLQGQDQQFAEAFI